jgi:hypothetical protein
MPPAVGKVWARSPWVFRVLRPLSSCSMTWPGFFKMSRSLLQRTRRRHLRRRLRRPEGRPLRSFSPRRPRRAVASRRSRRHSQVQAGAGVERVAPKLSTPPDLGIATEISESPERESGEKSRIRILALSLPELEVASGLESTLAFVGETGRTGDQPPSQYRPPDGPRRRRSRRARHRIRRRVGNQLPRSVDLRRQGRHGSLRCLGVPCHEHDKADTPIACRRGPIGALMQTGVEIPSATENDSGWLYR